MMIVLFTLISQSWLTSSQAQMYQCRKVDYLFNDFNIILHLPNEIILCNVLKKDHISHWYKQEKKLRQSLLLFRWCIIHILKRFDFGFQLVLNSVRTIVKHSMKSDQNKSFRMWIVNAFWFPNSKLQTPNLLNEKRTYRNESIRYSSNGKKTYRDVALTVADPSIKNLNLSIEIIRWIDGYYPYYVGVIHLLFFSPFNINFFCFSSEFQSHGIIIALAGFSFFLFFYIHFFSRSDKLYVCLQCTLYIVYCAMHPNEKFKSVDAKSIVRELKWLEAS